MTINETLFSYLRERFYKNNHAKYRKYFDEWINNVTKSQLYYFEIERMNIINNAKAIH